MTAKPRMLRDYGEQHLAGHEELVSEISLSLRKLDDKELRRHMRLNRDRTQRKRVPQEAKLTYRACIDEWLRRNYEERV